MGWLPGGLANFNIKPGLNIDVRSNAADPEKLERWIAVKLDSWMAGQLTCCIGDSRCQNIDILMASVSLNRS